MIRTIIICYFCCRSPHGERGFKFYIRIIFSFRFKSLPAWGAWIQVQDQTAHDRWDGVAPRMGSVDSSRNDGYKRTERCMSLPAWGAWIQVSVRSTMNCLTSVAPRTGSVDSSIINKKHSNVFKSRSPHGERGFKWFMRNTDSIFSRSLS